MRVCYRLGADTHQRATPVLLDFSGKAGLWHSHGMEHFWQDLPPEVDGLKWFAGVTIYSDQVRRARDGAVFVELGAWKGRSASFMGVEISNSRKRIDFYVVDHWRGSDEPAHHADPDVRAGRLFEVFERNIAPVKDYVRTIQGDSADSAQRFDDGSVDFVYVDASHEYEGVKRDLNAWWPKLRPGGVLAGDDWQFEGVARAVLEFAHKHGLSHRVLPGNPNDWKQWEISKP